MTEPQIPEQFWSLMQQHLGYTDAEMALFRSQPHNARVLAAALEMRNKTIVFEVVESAGCNSQHHVGTRFYFTGDGNLISKMAPSRVCAFATPVMAQSIFALHELMYAGVDPNQATFKRLGCPDVGVRCGGWGRIVLEARVVDREEAARMHREQA
jgi:uncharacterized repeat protein (TIGR04076 family)